MCLCTAVAILAQASSVRAPTFQASKSFKPPQLPTAFLSKYNILKFNMAWCGMSAPWALWTPYDGVIGLNKDWARLDDDCPYVKDKVCFFSLGAHLIYTFPKSIAFQCLPLPSSPLHSNIQQQATPPSPFPPYPSLSNPTNPPCPPQHSYHTPSGSVDPVPTHSNEHTRNKHLSSASTKSKSMCTASTVASVELGTSDSSGVTFS